MDFIAWGGNCSDTREIADAHCAYGKASCTQACVCTCIYIYKSCMQEKELWSNLKKSKGIVSVVHPMVHRQTWKYILCLEKSSKIVPTLGNAVISVTWQGKYHENALYLCVCSATIWVFFPIHPFAFQPQEFQRNIHSVALGFGWTNTEGQDSGSWCLQVINTNDVPGVIE